MKTIVQIGVANADDHVFEYIKQSNDEIFGIFVEPNPYSIPIIQTKYNFIQTKIISNIAISKYNGNIKLYLPPWFQSGDAQTASVYKNHLVAHSTPENTIQEIQVLCLTLNTYLNCILGFNSNNKIDKLFIDVEGHDCEILLSTDFSKLNINEIMFETSHTSGPMSGDKNIYTDNFNLVSAHLKLYGYELKEIIPELSSVCFSRKT